MGENKKWVFRLLIQDHKKLAVYQIAWMGVLAYKNTHKQGNLVVPFGGLNVTECILV